MKRARTACIGTALACAIGGLTLALPQAIAASDTAAGPDGEGTIATTELAAVASVGEQVAAAAGQPHAVMEVASSNVGAALPAISPGYSPPQITDPRTGLPWPETPVYVVAMQGSFVDPDAKVPSGVAPPSGTSLTLAIDAMSGRVISLHLGSGPALDLHALGTVTSVTR
jgi:hypothetical protein